MDCIFSEYPQLSVKVKVASQKSCDEHFCVKMGATLAQIEAASFLAASYAKAQMLAALQANRLGDFVGTNIPQFGLRLLWLDAFDVLTKEQLFDLGYNTLVLPFRNLSCELICDIRKSGIKIATRCTSLDEVGCAQGTSDYIVWQQGTLACGGQKTPFEQAVSEVEVLAKACPLPFFYYTTANCSFLLDLARMLPKNSAVLFDATLNDGLSTVFAELSQLPYEGTHRLLPMLSVSQHMLPECSAFSDFPVAAIETVFGRQRQGRFVGAACRVGLLAKSGTIAEMPIWVVGQKMWRTQDVQSLFETWLSRYWPAWSPWLGPDLIQIINKLFRCRDKAHIEKAAAALVELAEVLSQYKTALRFQKTQKTLEELSRLLWHMQHGFKQELEALCVQKMCKTPLALQNFTPISFHVAQKSAHSVK